MPHVPHPQARPADPDMQLQHNQCCCPTIALGDTLGAPADDRLSCPALPVRPVKPACCAAFACHLGQSGRREQEAWRNEIGARQGLQQEGVDSGWGTKWK